MRIIVIDNTQKHLTAALQTLAGHDITICDTHDKALELLRSQKDNAIFKKLYAEYQAASIANAYEKACQESALPYWDAVLCDLLMPAGRNAQGEGMRLVGQEMAVGWSLALMAARNGAKFVAVVSDMNHHAHPASAMLDAINHHIFDIDGTKMLMTNDVARVGIIGTECACKECAGSGKTGRGDGCWRCKESGTDFTEKGKDWGKILEQLVGNTTAE